MKKVEFINDFSFLDLFMAFLAGMATMFFLTLLYQLKKFGII